MNNEKGLQRVEKTRDESEDLRVQLEKAHASLAEAEAELAEEQAAVNAFRLHCRIKLDDLVDRLLQLRSEREALLVNLELLRQGVDPLSFDDDPLSEEAWFEEREEEEDILLPMDTPADKAAEKRLYRELARRFHPDLAVSSMERVYRTTIMSAINTAHATGDIETLFDLAGELTPEDAANLERITDVKARRISKTINKMRRLERKATRQLVALRQENTARLWRRVQSLDEHDEDGWSTIRRELEQAITRREAEISELRDRIEKLNLIEEED